MIRAEVALKPRTPAKLTQYATAVSSPSSPLYHHYMSPGSFRSEFGPTKATVRAVSTELRASGLRVTSVSRNGLLVDFSGPASRVSAAFHTSLENYRLPSGRVAFAPTSALRMSAAVAPHVQGVVGLSRLSTPQPVGALRGGSGHRAAKAPTSTTSSSTGPTACAAAKADASAYGGLTDQAIADAYGVNGLYSQGDDGAGQTIAIYELEPYLTSDIQTFDTCYFGSSAASAMLSRLHLVNVDGGNQIGAGSGESELDIDDVSAVAPGATIDVYEAPNTYSGYIDNFNAIVQNDTAQVVTSSWYSGCETTIAEEEPGIEQLENTIFEQAAAQGQTVLEAAGDDGSDGCSIHGSSPAEPILSSSDPASDPFVVSVGGTTITNASDPPTEQVWNDGALWGAGSGGISAIWGAPSWQVDSSVPGVDNSTVVGAAEDINGGPFCSASVCREIPDVSAQADEFTGAVTVYESPFGGWFTIGGTSSATPLWAAMLADINSTSACVSNGGIGFVSPELYAIASNPTQYADSFNDITTGNNDVFGVSDGLYPATTGYDMGAGLGSPKVTNPNGTNGLAYYLCHPTSNVVPTISSVDPAAVPASGGSVVITGTGFESGSSPDVAGLQLGTDELASTDFTVESSTTIDVTVPAASALAGSDSSTDGTGDYDVVATLTDGESSVPSANSRILYYAGTASGATPEVDGVDIAGGNEAGGMTVNVYGSGFSAGTSAPTVTFGGVPGTDVTVVNDSLLTVVVPAYQSGTTVCSTDLDPTTDICQVEVQVTNSNGSSAEAPITDEFSGLTANLGLVPGEFLPVATEFDYLPTPTITSISVEGGDASEAGGSYATIEGSGLGDLGIDYVDVGNYQDLSSLDYSLVYVSATKVVVELPGEAATTTKQSVPVTVQTEGSTNNSDLTGTPPSNAMNVTYAPTPELNSIAVESSGGQKSAYTAGPASGGTNLVVSGAGFADFEAVVFTDIGSGLGGVYGFSDATSFSPTSLTPNKLSIDTPSDNPGIDSVAVCNISGCTAPLPNGDTYVYYPDGNPKLTSISKSTGKAGTKVTISGVNLGFVEAVYFGKTAATTFANVPGLLDSGSTSEITATVPKGTAGSKVKIQVLTLESIVTGYGKSHTTKDVTFTYSK